MVRFILNRILWMIPVLWLVATVTFVLMHATPGSPWDAKNAAAGGRLSPALKVALLLGLPLGVVAALRQNTWVDYLSLAVATLGYTVPSFVVALFCIVLFAVKL